jgi:spore germination protein GerM
MARWLRKAVETRDRRTATAALVLLALGLSGSNATETPPAAVAASRAAPTVETTLYFLTRDRAAPLGARRPIARKSPYALEALRALVNGPTAQERHDGVTTAIPAGVKVLSFRIDANTRAVVNLSGLPAKAGGVDRVRVITQITRSLVGLSGIERVSLRNNGKPWGLWRMSGGVADVAYGYENLLGFTRICGGRGGCFSALP